MQYLCLLLAWHAAQLTLVVMIFMQVSSGEQVMLFVYSSHHELSYDSN